MNQNDVFCVWHHHFFSPSSVNDGLWKTPVKAQKSKVTPHYSITFVLKWRQQDRIWCIADCTQLLLYVSLPEFSCSQLGETNAEHKTATYWLSFGFWEASQHRSLSFRGKPALLTLGHLHSVHTFDSHVEWKDEIYPPVQTWCNGLCQTAFLHKVSVQACIWSSS